MVNPEIKEIIKFDERDSVLDYQLLLCSSKSHRQYKKETGAECYKTDEELELIDDSDYNENIEPTLEESKENYTSEYLVWFDKYYDILINRLKKVKCSNCGEIIQYIHKNKPDVCPNCGNVYWNKPLDEFTLFTLQDEYLLTRDNKILTQMYTILKLYAKKLIVKMVKNKFYFSKIELDMKAHDSVNKMMLYYLEKPAFRVGSSFGGYLKWPIRGVLYGEKAEDNLSLNQLIGEDVEFGDCLPLESSSVQEKLQVEFESGFLDSQSKVTENIYNIVCQQIIPFLVKTFSSRLAFLTLVGISHKLSAKSESFMDSYYLYTGLEVQEYVNTSVAVVYKYLKSLV